MNLGLASHYNLVAKKYCCVSVSGLRRAFHYYHYYMTYNLASVFLCNTMALSANGGQLKMKARHSKLGNHTPEWGFYQEKRTKDAVGYVVMPVVLLLE